VNAPTLALSRAQARIIERLGQLEPRLDEGDATTWSAYCQAASALAAITSHTMPGSNGRLMTTRELAESMGVSPKTILRKRKTGELTAVQLGQRGRAALRWRGDEVLR